MINSLKTFRRYFGVMKYCLLITPLALASCTTTQNKENEEYYSIDDYANVSKTDVHVHVFTNSNDFADIARAENFKLVSVALDAANTTAGVQRQFDFCQIQKANNPATVESITAFSMEGWDQADWLEKNLAWLDSSINEGAIGVKIWKNIGMVYRDKDGKLVMIDDPGFDPIFKMLAERQVPVLGHLGEPKNCWLPLEEMTTNNDRNYFDEHPQYHMYQHPDLPSYEEQIAARDRMLEKNPDLIFVGAHLGSLEWSVDELAKRLDKFPNMAVDMAARMGQLFYQTHFDREKVREFFIKYQDRLLYATDLSASGTESAGSLRKELHATWMRDWKYLVTNDSLSSDLVNVPYQGLQLPREVVDKIYDGNARKWLRAFADKSSATAMR